MKRRSRQTTEIMPPRFPHRLTKPPTQMSHVELTVLAILGASVTIGLYQVGSNVMQVYGRSSGVGNTGIDAKTMSSESRSEENQFRGK